MHSFKTCVSMFLHSRALVEAYNTNSITTTTFRDSDLRDFKEKEERGRVGRK